jgi:hypothetical protein
VLGALSFLTLLAFVAIRSGRQGHVVGPALILAILVFSSFHYILRQPVFWFDILAVGALGDPPGMLHRVRTVFQAASTCTTPT